MLELLASFAVRFLPSNHPSLEKMRSVKHHKSQIITTFKIAGKL